MGGRHTYAALLYPPNEIGKIARRGRQFLMVGPTFGSRDSAIRALQPDLKDVVDRDLPLVGLVVELAGQRVVDSWRVDPRRKNPGTPRDWRRFNPALESLGIAPAGRVSKRGMRVVTEGKPGAKLPHDVVPPTVVPDGFKWTVDPGAGLFVQGDVKGTKVHFKAPLKDQVWVWLPKDRVAELGAELAQFYRMTGLPQEEFLVRFVEASTLTTKSAASTIRRKAKPKPAEAKAEAAAKTERETLKKKREKVAQEAEAAFERFTKDRGPQGALEALDGELTAQAQRIEQLKAKLKEAKPSDKDAIEQRVKMARYRQRMLGKERARAAELVEFCPPAERAPAPKPPSVRLPGGAQVVEGAATTLFYPGPRGPMPLRGFYALIPASKLRASHHPVTFRPTPGYDQSLQERDYQRDVNEQRKVIAQAQQFAPALVLNSNADAVNGPPIVDGAGQVLGGNSRAMTVLRVLKDDPKRYTNALKHAVQTHCEVFGLEGATDAQLRDAVLVRVLDDTRYEARDVSNLFNRSLTQSIASETGAVSIGKMIPARVYEELGELMAEGLSLAQALRKRQDVLVRQLQTAGIITPQNIGEWTKNNRLSSAGIEKLTRAMTGALLGDRDIASRSGEFPKLMEVYHRLAPIALALDAWDAENATGYNWVPAFRVATKEAPSVYNLAPARFNDHYRNLSLVAPAVPELYNLDRPLPAVMLRWLTLSATQRPAQAARGAMDYWRGIPDEVRSPDQVGMFARSSDQLRADRADPEGLRARTMGTDSMADVRAAGSVVRYLGELEPTTDVSASSRSTDTDVGAPATTDKAVGPRVKAAGKRPIEGQTAMDRAGFNVHELVDEPGLQFFELGSGVEWEDGVERFDVTDGSIYLQEGQPAAVFRDDEAGVWRIGSASDGAGREATTALRSLLTGAASAVSAARARERDEGEQNAEKVRAELQRRREKKLGPADARTIQRKLRPMKTGLVRKALSKLVKEGVVRRIASPTGISSLEDEYELTSKPLAPVIDLASRRKPESPPKPASITAAEAQRVIMDEFASLGVPYRPGRVYIMRGFPWLDDSWRRPFLWRLTDKAEAVKVDGKIVYLTTIEKLTPRGRSVVSWDPGKKSSHEPTGRDYVSHSTITALTALPQEWPSVVREPDPAKPKQDRYKDPATGQYRRLFKSHIYGVFAPTPKGWTVKKTFKNRFEAQDFAGTLPAALVDTFASPPSKITRSAEGAAKHRALAAKIGDLLDEGVDKGADAEVMRQTAWKRAEDLMVAVADGQAVRLAELETGLAKLRELVDHLPPVRTQGTHIEWETLEDWLRGLAEIEGRRVSAGQDTARKSHLEALAKADEAVVRAGTIDELERTKETLKELKRNHRSSLKTVVAPLQELVNNELNRRREKEKKAAPEGGYAFLSRPRIEEQTAGNAAGLKLWIGNERLKSLDRYGDELAALVGATSEVKFAEYSGAAGFGGYQVLVRLPSGEQQPFVFVLPYFTARQQGKWQPVWSRMSPDLPLSFGTRQSGGWVAGAVEPTPSSTWSAWVRRAEELERHGVLSEHNQTALDLVRAALAASRARAPAAGPADVVIRVDEGGTVVQGNTRPYKDAIKQLRPRLRWSRRQSFWYVPRNQRQPFQSQLEGWAQTLRDAGATVAIEGKSDNDIRPPKPTAMSDRPDITIPSSAVSFAPIPTPNTSERLWTDAFRHLYQSPERHAKTMAREFQDEWNDLYRVYEGRAGSDAQKWLVAKTLNERKGEYVRLWRDFLTKASRASSWHVTGPSGRNETRERKRIDAMDTAQRAISDYVAATRKELGRLLKRADVQEQGGVIPDLQRRLQEREASQRRMKAVNKVLRSKKLTEAQKIAQLANEHAMGEPTVRALLKPAYRGAPIGFTYEIKNNGAEIRRLKKRIEQEEQRVRGRKDNPAKTRRRGGTDACQNTCAPGRRPNRANVLGVTNTLYGLVELHEHPRGFELALTRPTGERVVIADVTDGRRTFFTLADQIPAPESELIYGEAPAAAYYAEARARDLLGLLRNDGFSVPDALRRPLSATSRAQVRRDLRRELTKAHTAIAKGDRSEALYAKASYLEDLLSSRRRNPDGFSDWVRRRQMRGDCVGWSVPICYRELERYESEHGPVAEDRDDYVARHWRSLRPHQQVAHG